MKSRREFIKISTLGLGGIAAGSYMTPFVRGAAPKGEESKMSCTPTWCEVCFWKCAGWVYTNNEGVPVKISGNKDDIHSNGRFCPRGTGGIGMFTDKDRLTTPLIRVDVDGKQSFREATWEEALELVAGKLKETASKYGSESVALFKHGSAGKYFQHLFKAFGTENITAPSYAQCRGPRDDAWKITYGTDVGSPEVTDIRDTNCLVLLGSHIGENMHNGQVQEMAHAIDRGAIIITVDPRFSIAASKSKYWLPIKPSTDLALVLAWINVIITEGLYDKEYVEKYTSGFDKLKEHVLHTTPEWAYGITEIKPNIIRKTAREMANAAPAVVVHPGRHVTWYGDDTQRTRSIAILNALLGSWGRRGGFFLKEKAKIPHIHTPDYPEVKWCWKDAKGDKYPLAKKAISNLLLDMTIPGRYDEHRIRSWFVSGTNLPSTMPNYSDFEKAVEALDFLVVVDTMPMEMTGYADVVLPECTYFERYDDLRNASHREPQIALRMPATKPLGESKPGWWIAKSLGEKLGLSEYFPYKDYKEVLDWQLKEMGYSLAEIEAKGVISLHKKKKLYFEKGAKIKFKTPSKKIELYSTKLEKMGFDPMPKYTSHPKPPEGYYRLNYGRAPMHTFSRTSNNNNLAEVMDENKLWVNPKVAQQWGIEDGEYLRLKSDKGLESSSSIKVFITEMIRWDTVYMVHGFGHKDKRLSRAFGKGISDSELMSETPTDPLMGGTGLRGTFVTFIIDKQEKSAIS